MKFPDKVYVYPEDPDFEESVLYADADLAKVMPEVQGDAKIGVYRLESVKTLAVVLVDLPEGK